MLVCCLCVQMQTHLRDRASVRLDSVLTFSRYKPVPGSSVWFSSVGSTDGDFAVNPHQRVFFFLSNFFWPLMDLFIRQLEEITGNGMRERGNNTQQAAAGLTRTLVPAARRRPLYMGHTLYRLSYWDTKQLVYMNKAWNNRFVLFVFVCFRRTTEWWWEDQAASTGRVSLYVCYWVCLVSGCSTDWHMVAVNSVNHTMRGREVEGDCQ